MGMEDENEDENEDDAEDGDEVHCPYCDTTENCDHLLLMVDKTFRYAEGGLLVNAFNSRWADITEKANDPDFEEQDPFAELLEEVESLSGVALNASFDGAPGMSSAYSYYFCSSKRKTMAAVKAFGKA